MMDTQMLHAVAEAMNEVVGEFEISDCPGVESVTITSDHNDARELAEALDRLGYKIVRKWK